MNTDTTVAQTTIEASKITAPFARDRPMLKVDNYDLYPLREQHYYETVEHLSQAFATGTFMLDAYRELGTTLEDQREEYNQEVAESIELGWAFALFESDSNSKMVGCMLCLPPGYKSKVVAPPGLRAENALIDKAISGAHTKNPDLKNYAYVGASFIHSEYQGQNLPIKSLTNLAIYLKETRGIPGIYTLNMAPQMLRSHFAVGVKVVETTYFDEFELDGGKPLAAVKPNKYFIGGRPAYYVLSLNYNDIKTPAKL
jgi:hypothetical protein